MGKQVIARRPCNMDLILSVLPTDGGKAFTDITKEFDGTGITAISGSLGYARNKGYVVSQTAPPSALAHLSKDEQRVSHYIYRLTPAGEKRLRTIPGGVEWCQKTLKDLKGVGTPLAQRKEAAEWLREQLANGPVHVDVLRANAELAKISWEVVRTANSDLVRAVSEKTPTGNWRWRLPEQQEKQTETNQQEQKVPKVKWQDGSLTPAPSAEPKDYRLEDGFELVNMLSDWRNAMNEQGVQIDLEDEGSEIALSIRYSG